MPLWNPGAATTAAPSVAVDLILKAGEGGRTLDIQLGRLTLYH